MDRQQQLPVGFRFRPTDKELLLHYLRRKLCSSLPTTVDVIPTVSHVFRSNPWDLPGDLKEKRYFFCKNKSNSCLSSSKCSTTSGFWKHTLGKDKQITVSGQTSATATGRNLVIGIKKSFVFHLFHHHQANKSLGDAVGPKTQWVMREFCLVSSISTPYLKQMGDWVVCCVYQRKMKVRNDHRAAKTKESTGAAAASGGHTHTMNFNNIYRLESLLAQNSSSSPPPPPSPSSSCSSGITVIDGISLPGPTSDLDQEEATS